MAKAFHALIVSAHPDDVDFGVAGTVAKWTKSGLNVAYAICTNGDKGTSDPNVKPADLARLREKEQRAAAEAVGVHDVVFLGYPDQSLEDTPEFREAIVRQIRIFRPKLLATSDPYRKYIWHRDHRITGQVALDAVYPYARDHLAYPKLTAEGLKPHKVEEVYLWGSMDNDINLRVDITDTFEQKLAALRCHKSQVGNRLESDLLKWIKNRATHLAEGEKFQLAEGFHREAVWM